MYNYVNESIKVVTDYDQEIGKALQLELNRQQNNLELIASENIVSNQVLASMGSIMANKYAEGYPRKR